MQGVWDPRSSSLENIVAIPRERTDLLERIARAKLGLRSITASGSTDGNHVAAFLLHSCIAMTASSAMPIFRCKEDVGRMTTANKK